MNRIYLVSYKRTPIGSYGGALKSLTAIDLGVKAAKEVISDSNLNKSLIDDCIIGNVLSANNGQAPARQIGIKSGLPNTIPSTTVNKVCASGLKALTYSATSIRLGLNRASLVGGTESMSNAPYYISSTRFGAKYGDQILIDGMLKDGLWDSFDDHHMGNAAEHTNEQMDISREEQDEYAIRSYRLAEQASKSGYFDDEIVPIQLETKHQKITVQYDEEIDKVHYDKIPQLSPTFKKGGSITPANASSLNDGAAMITLANEDVIKSESLVPMAEIIDFQDVATKPIDFTIAPQLAIKKLLSRHALTLNNIDLFEINEAYANTVIANARLLDLDLKKVNISGGAVALGHPIGMSGARIIGTLARNLKNRNLEYGIATICNGGGGATAVLIKNAS